MYYSSIGILAILILIIINYNLLFRFKNKDLDQTHKAYKFFLISVGSFYIADILWSPLYILNVRIINFIETSLYFVIMAFSVYFWTKYVILYLNEKNTFAKFLSLTGIIFLVAQIIVLTVNLFVPIAFWFEEDGTYHTSIARNINLATQVIIFILVDLYMIRVILRTDGNIRRRHLAIGLFCLNMILFITLQALDPYMPYYSIGCMLGTCLLHTFVLEDEKAAHKEHLESILKVEEMQELELGKTRKMAYSDPLTGVKNKMAYIEDVGGIEQKIEDEFLKDFGIVVFDSQGVFPGGNAFFNRDVVFAFMVGTNVDIADDIGGFQLDDGFISIIAVSGVQIDLSVDVSVHVKIRGSAFLDRGVNAAVYERGVAKIAGNIGVGFAAADVHGDQIFDVAVNVRFTRAVFALEF